MKKRAGTLLTLCGQSYIDNLAEHQRQGAIERLNALHATAANYNDELAASSADPSLTTEGRAERSFEAATSALAELDAFEAAEIHKLTARAKAIEKALLAKVVSVAPKDAAHELQLREVRDQLRLLSAAERLAIYRSTEDPLTIAAIETAPQTLSAPRQDGSRRLEPFVDSAELAAVQWARAEAAAPAEAQVLREVQSLEEVLRLAANGLRREIQDAMPGSGPAPVPTVV